ncbi:hypothetical protein EVAR_61578_1 [Eumeta japonica]|uniref:Uncharacterized protein n=1 Tax=Eumeta variegata TaxID=151549 RepID=A0A4C1YW00_EUMVA|nr:hypothetical protein EVAR_61578_1 [Eumeta japonica]
MTSLGSLNNDSDRRNCKKVEKNILADGRVTKKTKVQRPNSTPAPPRQRLRPPRPRLLNRASQFELAGGISAFRNFATRGSSEARQSGCTHFSEKF